MPDAQNEGKASRGVPRERIKQGLELLRQGRLAEARQIRDVLLVVNGDSAEVLYFACEVQLAGGDAEAALDLIEAAILKATGNPVLLVKKARILLSIRRRDDARLTAVKAVATAGLDSRALWSIGRLYGDCNDLEHALKIYEQALSSDGGNHGLQYDLAAARFFAGDFADAERTLDTLVVDAPQIGHAYYLRSTLRRQTTARNHVAELEARLGKGFAKPAEHAACLYALAKEFEDLREDGRSFAALTEGAAFKRRTLQYDAPAERRTIENVGAAFTAEAMTSATTGHDEVGAIFIVGMPRSGTTLVERLLGRHSDVRPAGELMDFRQILASAARAGQAAQPGKTMAEASLMLDFAALGRDYMRGAREAAHGSGIFVDKMPANFIYCGHIHQALPNARLIHLVRDPMDSCYATYKTLFHQAYHFSYDLDELADYFATYRRLMRHWREVLPGAILDVRYEDLVTDFEVQARRIVDWCRLDWQDSVLNPSHNEHPSVTASAAQVREPVHAGSVHKWRRFRTGLAPLQARLIAAGIECNEW